MILALYVMRQSKFAKDHGKRFQSELASSFSSIVHSLVVMPCNDLKENRST